MSNDFDDNISLGYCSDVPQFSPDSYNMRWPQQDSTSGIWIEFVEQPADYRYRYLKERYHGHIVGESSPNTKKKDLCKFPKLKLHNYSGPAIVRVWLITTELDKPRAHFHKLARKPPKGVLNLEPHDFSASEVNNFEVTLDYLHIVHAVNNDENDINSYRIKKEHIESGLYISPNMIPPPNKNEKDEIKQMDKNQSIFYVQVFDKETGTKICESVSRKIKNLHNAETGALKIVNFSRTFGTCRGDDEIFIFVEKISKDVEVRFFKLDDNKKRIWEAPAIYGPHNVHHQLGIVFRTPKYVDDVNKDTQVFFELHRKNDGAISDPVSFTYKPHDDYKFHGGAKKRPHSPETASSEGEYLPSVVTSFSSKRIKDESMSPDSTTVQAVLDNISETSSIIYPFPLSLLSSDPVYINDVTIDHLLNTDVSSLIGQELNTDVSSLIGQELNPDGDDGSSMDDSFLIEGNISLGDMNDLLPVGEGPYLQFDGVSSSEGPIEGIKMKPKVKAQADSCFSSNGVNKSLKSISTDRMKVVPKSDCVTSSLSQKVDLLTAICQRYPIQEVLEILSNIEDVNVIDYEGYSALHYAAETSAEYLLPLLEIKNLDRNLRNLWGDDALLHAVRSGNLMAVKVLLQKKFEPNVQNSRTGETPLHLAISDENYPMAELLLQHGADPLVDNHSDQSAYEYSLNCGTAIRRLTYISMQKNMFKKRGTEVSIPARYSAIEHDLVGKLNGLVVSSP